MIPLAQSRIKQIPPKLFLCLCLFFVFCGKNMQHEIYPPIRNKFLSTNTVLTVGTMLFNRSLEFAHPA